MPFLKRTTCAMAMMAAMAGLAHGHGLETPPITQPDGALDVVRWNNHVYRIHKRAADGDGSIGALIAEFPYGEAPPLHIHHDAAETFHVLDGAIEIMVDGEPRALAAGETATVGKGVQHSFVVTSPDGARIFIAFTPGGFEGFFAAVEGLEIPRDMEAISAIGAEFDLSIVGPPLSLGD